MKTVFLYKVKDRGGKVRETVSFKVEMFQRCDIMKDPVGHDGYEVV